MLRVAQDNIVPPHVTVTGILEISDASDRGLESVREALLEAEKVDPQSVTVQYVGAPRYRVQVAGTQYKQAEEILKRATDAALVRIRASGGHGTFSRL
jgi:translation initiation factor 2 subunit 1